MTPEPRKTASAVRAHEHFCSMCYGRGKVKGVSRGQLGSGWWRCTLAKCARPMDCYCRVHTLRLESNA